MTEISYTEKLSKFKSLMDEKRFDAMINDIKTTASLFRPLSKLNRSIFLNIVNYVIDKHRIIDI